MSRTYWRHPGLRTAFAVPLLMVFGAACSKGDSTDDSYTKAVAAAQASMQAATEDWASKVATAGAQELEAKGTVDPNRLAEIATTSAGPVKEVSCEAVKKNKGLYNTGQHSLDGRLGLRDFVEREMVAAFGKVPLVLHDFKVDWPPSWLADPSNPPQYAGPANDADPAYLKAVLVPRLVGPDGSFVAPTLDSRDYPNLLGWAIQRASLSRPDRGTHAPRELSRLRLCQSTGQGQVGLVQESAAQGGQGGTWPSESQWERL